jgi:clan AA aspartic protease (TIGR02281 family)
MIKHLKQITLTTAVILFSISVFSQTVIRMEKKGGVYYVPCIVNGLKLQFIFDTGADDVSISLSEAVFMIKNGYMSEDDLIGTEYYRIANGEVAEGTKIMIKELLVGDKTLYDVKASIVHTLSAPLLLGQSAIERFGKFSVDYSTNTLVLGGTSTPANVFTNSSHQTRQQTSTATNSDTKTFVNEQLSSNTGKAEKKYEDSCKYPTPIPTEIKETIQKCTGLYMAAKFSECSTCYDNLISKYPDYCVGYYNRGLAKYFSGDKEGAKIDFDKAISLGFLEAKELLNKYYRQ